MENQNITEFWNTTLQKPVTCTLPVFPTQQQTDVLQAARKTLRTAAQYVSQQDQLAAEFLILKKLLYMRHGQLRRDKSFQGLKQIQSCLRRYFDYGLDKVIKEYCSDFENAVLQEGVRTHLPSRQMWEYFLTHFLGASALLTSTASRCAAVFLHVHRIVTLGNHIPLNMVFLSALSRIWASCQAMCLELQKWYKRLIPVSMLASTQFAWLPAGETLPADLCGWLSAGGFHSGLITNHGQQDSDDLSKLMELCQGSQMSGSTDDVIDDVYAADDITDKTEVLDQSLPAAMDETLLELEDAEEDLGDPVDLREMLESASVDDTQEVRREKKARPAKIGKAVNELTNKVQEVSTIRDLQLLLNNFCKEVPQCIGSRQRKCSHSLASSKAIFRKLSHKSEEKQGKNIFLRCRKRVSKFIQDFWRKEQKRERRTENTPTPPNDSLHASQNANNVVKREKKKKKKKKTVSTSESESLVASEQTNHDDDVVTFEKKIKRKRKASEHTYKDDDVVTSKKKRKVRSSPETESLLASEHTKDDDVVTSKKEKGKKKKVRSTPETESLLASEETNNDDVMTLTKIRKKKRKLFTPDTESLLASELTNDVTDQKKRKRKRKARSTSDTEILFASEQSNDDHDDVGTSKKKREKGKNARSTQETEIFLALEHTNDDDVVTSKKKRGRKKKVRSTQEPESLLASEHTNNDDVRTTEQTMEKDNARSTQETEILHSPKQTNDDDVVTSKKKRGRKKKVRSTQEPESVLASEHTNNDDVWTTEQTREKDNATSTQETEILHAHKQTNDDDVVTSKKKRGRKKKVRSTQEPESVLASEHTNNDDVRTTEQTREKDNARSTQETEILYAPKQTNNDDVVTSKKKRGRKKKVRPTQEPETACFRTHK